MSDEPIPISRALKKVAGSAARREVDIDLEGEIGERRRIAAVMAELGRAEIEQGRSDPDNDLLLVGAKLATANLIQRILGGEFPITSAREAAQVLKALHEVARLEAGQATQINAEVSADDVLKQLASFKDKIQARVGDKVIDVGG